MTHLGVEGECSTAGNELNHRRFVYLSSNTPNGGSTRIPSNSLLLLKSRISPCIVMTVGLLYDGINCLLTGNYYMMEEIVRERHASILTEIDHLS
jgi:hypothetical protein